MAHVTFDDFLNDTPLAKAHRERHKTRPSDAVAAFVSGLQEGLQALSKSTTAKAAAKSAVDELEQLVAERIHANPALTRQSVVGEIFRANPGLYDRVREETTLDTHGRTLREIYGRVETSKADRVHSADEEVTVKAQMVMAKSAGLTFEQAVGVVLRHQPDLAARWQAEAYA